jgi:hypothetical protein
MEKKRIKIYKDMNGPYEEMLRQGHIDTPEERFEKFFRERAKFRAFIGWEKPKGRSITIKKVTWI